MSIGNRYIWQAGYGIDHRREGVTLLEVVVYLALVSMVCVLVLTRVVEMVPAYQALYTRSQLQSIALRVHDVLSADYHRAEKVYCFDDSMICCDGEDCAYGWELRCEKLYRVVGTYDVREYQWRTKRSITMAHGVITCNFTQHDDLLNVALVLERRGQRYEISWDAARRLGAMW